MKRSTVIANGVGDKVSERAGVHDNAGDLTGVTVGQVGVFLSIHF